MGQVAIVYAIMPESPEIDLSKLKDEIAKAVPPFAVLKGTAEKPVAYGLNAIHVMVTLDDKKGGAEDIEKAFSQLKGVQSVDTVEISLV